MQSQGKKSPKGCYQTNDQQKYQSKIKEMRNKFKPSTVSIKKEEESDNKEEVQGIDKTRQPILTGLTPEYDLKLFLEAQAAASEKIVSILL